MSRHDDLVRVRHMLDHAQEAAVLVRGKLRDDLDSDRVLSLALVHLLEIIGEAASRVSGSQTSTPRDSLSFNHCPAECAGPLIVLMMGSSSQHGKGG